MAEYEPPTKKVKAPNHLRTLHERDQEKRLIIILEKSSLETVKVKIEVPDMRTGIVFG